MMFAVPYEIEVRHSFDAAHRVMGHENGNGKCARLHGHTYGIVVALIGERLDGVGFVVDYGVVKAIIDEWDHRTVLSADDPLCSEIEYDNPDQLVRVPFNPTAENMARHLAERFFALDGVLRASVSLHETPKTAARWTEARRIDQNSAVQLPGRRLVHPA